MKNKTLTYILTGVLLWLPLLSLSAQKEAEAKVVLEKTAQAFKKANGIEADFILTPYQHGVAQGDMKGNIQLMDENFLLTTPQMVTWFNGKTQWTYLPANEEVNVSTPTREELESINPLAFLSLYKEGYAYRLGSKTTHQGKAITEVVLTAEDFNKQWSNLTLYIDRTTLLPLYIKLKEAGKNYHEITISNYRQGMGWRKNHFTFDPKQYPNAEVIDLR